MGKINVLDKSVYNRLAAGEVVENPASIVKELAENSIDAGSSHLVIMIENGGIKSITVIDDGCGIEEEDLPLTVTPHATSKISGAEDLDTIATLGFRGEALASIAAISQIEIKSRFLESEVGKCIVVKGGEIESEGECALSGGTTVCVSSLFYNTPARYKFLKTPKGEEANVTRVTHELMLANPEVSIKYIVDGEVVCYTNGSGMDNALCAVLGQEICDNLVYFETAEKNYTVVGYVGRPATDAILPNKTKQVFIVNGRVFSDPNLPAVLQNAYGERLMKRTFPAAVIDIVMPFDEVDVNVHPGKKEVRFADKKLLSGMIYSAVKQALEKDQEGREEEMRLGMLLSNESRTNICLTLQRVMDAVESKAEEEVLQGDVSKTRIKELMKKYSVTESDLPPSIKKPPPRRNYWEGVMPTVDLTKLEPDQIYHAPFNVSDDVLLLQMDPGVAGQIARNPYRSDFEKGDRFKPAYVDEEEEIQEQETLQGIKHEYQPAMLPDEEEIGIRSRFRIVGQVFDTYIIIESGKRLFIIDQHAAHERILYDKFLEEISKSICVQRVLIPYYIQLSEEEMQVFKDNEKELWTMGFDIAFKADGVMEINSVPTLLTDMNLDSFVYSVLENGGEIKYLKDVKQIKNRFARIACKSAIKGGMKLTNSEIDYVMNYFFDKGMPLQCPHGRPTVIVIEQANVEKWFKRIV